MVTIVRFAVAALILLIPCSHSAAAGPIACPKLPGLLAGPFVKDTQTAMAIFLAVEAGIGFHPASIRRSIIKVEDEGDHWSAFRHADLRDQTAQPHGTFIVVAGGGQLEMDIDKCNGTVSNVALSR